jgi:hypothetical protein
MAVPSLTVVNNLTAVGVGGTVLLAKQGGVAAEFDEGYAVTVTGYPLSIEAAIPTATVVKVYDDDTHTPANPLYWHFWATANLYVQFVGATSQFTVPLHAYVPLVLYGNTILAAANTTDLTGGAEPTLEDVDHVNLANYSGGSADYKVVIVY